MINLDSGLTEYASYITVEMAFDIVDNREFITIVGYDRDDGKRNVIYSDTARFGHHFIEFLNIDEEVFQKANNRIKSVVELFGLSDIQKDLNVHLSPAATFYGSRWITGGLISLSEEEFSSENTKYAITELKALLDELLDVNILFSSFMDNANEAISALYSLANPRGHNETFERSDYCRFAAEEILRMSYNLYMAHNTYITFYCYVYKCLINTTDKENVIQRIAEHNSKLSSTHHLLGLSYKVNTVLGLINKNGLISSIDKAAFDADDYNNIGIFDTFDVNDSLFDICYYTYFNLVRHKVVVNTCQNCGRLFIPVIKVNEVYCDRVSVKGKTCKQVGYENKLNRDDLLKVYRTAYKTQNAKKLRNRHLPDVEMRFKKWHMEAKNKLADAREGKINLDDFKAWLKLEWL